MTAPQRQADIPPRDVYVARQPIFDERSEIFGYELLHRSSMENRYLATDDDLASLAVLSDSAFVFGLEALAGQGRAFVNFTRTSLINDFARVLPPERLIVEVLEEVVADDEVVAACRRLKERGYLIALDDFEPDGPSAGLVELADIVKIDFTVHTPASRQQLADTLLPRGVRLLAEKVETAAEVEQARRLGYAYAQGYFFARPEISVGTRSPGFKPLRLQLLQELNRADPDFDSIEDLFRHDPALSFQLLRYLNSAAFGLRSRVTSIRHSLVYLGQSGLRTWATVLILADAGIDRPFELIVTSVVRSRFCELVGRHIGMEARRHDLALLGLFSLIDAIFGRPMHDALVEMPLPSDVVSALCGEPNTLGVLLSLAHAYERADWPTVEGVARRLGLDAADVSASYFEAVNWGNRTGYLR
jgi:c-di-GMP-related signal transduction protein